MLYLPNSQIVLQVQLLYHNLFKNNTIFNYDEETGFGINNIFGGKKSDVLKQLMTVSDEVKSFFTDNLDKGAGATELFDDFYDSKMFNDKGFKEWYESLDKAKIETKTVGEVFDMYSMHVESSNEAMIKASSTTSKLTSGLKNIAGAVGSSLLNFGASMAVMAAITLAAKGIDYLIHYQDKMIEKGEKAKETISNTFDEFSSKKTAVNDLGKQFADSEKDITSTGNAIDSIGKKYTEFKNGIDRSTNKNIGLSDSDYQSYLDLSNQLAEQFPTLVSGYDAQGNAMLNLSSNAEIATAKIKELYNAQMLSSNVKIGEQLDDNYKGVVTQIDKYQGEIGEWKTKVEKNKKAQKDVLPSLKTISSGEIKFDAAAFGKNVGKVQNEINTILMKNGITVDENSQVSEDGTVRISAPKLSEGVSNEINKVFQKYGQDAANSLAIDNTKLEKQIHANELLIKDQLKSMTDSIGQYMQTSEVFTGLNSKLQDAFITNLPNLDINTISEDYGGDVQKFLYNEFLTPMENLAPESQQKLADLLSLDPKNLNIQEYQNLIDKTLKAVFFDKTERSNFKKALGLDAVVDDAKENLNNLKKQVSGFNADLLNTLSIDEIKQGLNITANDKFSGTFEEFVAKIKEAKALAETAIDIKANPKFDAIAKADETANAGDDYVKSIQYAKDAKEMYDKGLIGTDDFKTRAAYFSPTGADDDVNFAENYPKISRYMTEDATGVQNFLNDLKSKGLATFEILSDGTKKWSYDIKDLEESATSMGMGFEWFMDMFGRLEDYGFHNNFVGSVEEGTERITDLSTQLVDAQAELERLKATGADSTAISQQEEKVAQLKSDIEQTTQATKQLQEHAVEQYAKQIESAKTQISSLNEQRKSIQDSDYGGNGAAIRKLLGDKIKELADSNGIELDANLNIVNEDETIKALEGQKITVPIEYEQVDYKNIDKIKEKASKALEDGKFVTQNAILSIDLDSTSTENIDKQLSSLSDALSYIRKNNDGVLNIDSSEVQNALNILNALYAQKRKLADEKFNSMNLSGMDKSLSSAIEKLHEFQQLKIELDRQKNLQSVGVQIDTSTTQDAYDKIVKQLQNLDPEIQAKLGIDTSSEESIMQWIESFNPQITAQLNIDKTKAENELRGIAYSDENEIIMKVNADTSQIENAISSLQNGQSATFNASVTDSKGNSHDSTLVTGTKDEKGVIHYYAEFEDEGKVELEKNQDGKLVYKADVKDVEDKVSDLESENPKVKVELTPEEQKVQDALKSLLNDQTKTTFSVDADFSKVKDDINALEVGHSIVFTANVDGVDQAVAAVKYQDGSIGYIANVDGVYYQLSAVQNTDGTVSYTIGNYPTEVPNANQTIDRTPNNSQVSQSLFPVGQAVNRTPNNSGILHAPTIVQKVIRFFTGGDKLLGTAHASGTLGNSSNLKNSWKTKKDEVALTGEVGEELVVSGNRWFTTGSNGAEFANIPAGSVVFNSKQTKELFSQGFTKSRGKGNPSLPGLPAFLEGSAFAGGFGGGGFRGGASKSSSSKKKSSKSSSKSSSNSSSSSSKSNSSSDSSAKNETENLVDFIKILYDRVSRLSDLTEKAIDRAVGLVNKQAKATDAIDKIRTELSTAQQAANKYLEYANGVGLSEDYKRKIREGNLSIENITDEDLKDKVSKYQSYYEDYLSYSDKALDIQDKLTDLAEKRLSIIEDEYDAIEDIQKSLQDKLEADRDLLENLGTAIDNSLNTNSIKDAINSQAEVYNDLTKKLAGYQTEVQSQLNSGLMKKGSEQWYNAQKNINDFTANIAKASSELIELQDKLRQISYDTLQNIIEGFSRSTDKIGSYIELLEAKNERIPEKEYQKQLDNNNAAIKTQYDLRNKYLAEQAYYDVNSKKYQDLAEKINDADVNILKLQKDNEDLKDSIYSLRIKNLEDTIKGYADLEDELSNFRDLLNDDAFFDKQGGITDEGLAQITLLSQSLGNAKQKIADYTTGLQKIKELYANGVISLDEYNEKTKEYRDGIQDTTKDVKSYQDSLTDLYMKAMQTEVDYLDKIISKRKEALDKKKSYYEYDKKIKSQSKDINSIKAQIRALEGVNNLSSQSQRKKLEAELKEKEDELADTKRDHEYDMRSQGYDAMSDELKQLIEDTTYDLNHSADKRLEVINTMLDKEVGSYIQAFNKINSVISNTGFVGSTDFNNAQSQMSSQSGASTTKNNATQSQSSSNNKPSSAASGTNTSGIKDNSYENNKITEDIMKPENTDHRKVAELNVTRSSVSVQERSSVYVGTSIRPNDAENKNLEWKSNNTGVATVSNGTINGVRPGSCTVTVSTTDGSGLSKSISVTVTKKPEPPKPAPVTNTNGKDGILRVGDTATFSGRYYYDSWGKRPAGSKYAGVQNGVKVDSYSSSDLGGNAKRTGNYKVHIGGADGVYKDLGWVRPDQLSGYKNGIERVPYDQVAEINEGNKDETIITPKGHTLTLLTRNSSVLKNEAQKTLWDIANNPQLFAEKIMNSGFASAHVGSFADSIKSIKMPTVENNNQQNVNVENHYDSLLTVNGNVDKEALPKLQEILKQSCDYTRKEMVKDFEKLGHKIKR